MNKFLTFDGSKGYVIVPNYKGIAYPFDADLYRSITFWMRTTQSGSDSTICYWGPNLAHDFKNGTENRLRLLRGHLQLFSRGSARSTATMVADGNWHHIAFVYNPARNHFTQVRNFADADVYVDGVLDLGEVVDDGITTIFTTGEQDVLIGTRPTHSGGFGDFYKGDLDELAIYRDVISTATISGSYNGGVRGANLQALPEGTSLHLWFRMGDDPSDTVPSGVLSSGTLIDHSFYGRNGITFSGTSIGTE